MKKKIFLFFLLIINFGFSQTKISGKIIDQKTKGKLPYVDISAPNTNYYTTTNVDGTFYLEVNDSVDSLEISQFGYKTKKIAIKQGANYNFTIQLSPNETDLQEVVVNTKMKKYKNKKENPAYRILKEIWERKRKNGLKLFDNYQYEEYEKIEFDLNNIDSTFMKKKIFRKMEFIFNNIDTSRISGKSFLPLFINESISNVIGENIPSKKERKELIANKSSGFEDNQIVSETAKNIYKEYDIYDNRMNFFNKGFVSPIATDGFNHYEYQLMDSLTVEGTDCYRIKYFPKRPGELTFKGSFYVTKDSYVIKEITLATTKGINVNFVRDIYVELSFDELNDTIFLPKKTYTMLDLSLINKKNDSKGMFAHRTTSFKNYKFNQDLSKTIFNKKPIELTQEAYKKDDEFWQRSRHFELEKDEKQIYATLDSLEKVPKFRRIVDLSETITSGYYNFGNVFDLGNIWSIFGKNDIEGIRIRLGGRTFFSKNDLWRINFYTAYGFQDKKVKYGAEFRYMLNKNNRFTVGFGSKRDIEQLGVQLTSSDGIISRSFASSGLFTRGNNTSLSNIHKINAFSSIEIAKNVELRLDGTYQTISTESPDFKINYYNNNKLYDELTDTHTTLTLVMRPKAKYSLYGLDRYEHSTLSPTILFKYTRGFKNIINSGFDYDKLQFYYFHPLLIGSIGKLDLRFEAGKSFQPLPISLLSVIPGNQSYSIVPNVFSQLNYYEFVTDTYSTLMLEHHFNGRILGYIPLIKKLKFREVAFYRTAWGSISNDSKNINASSINYTAPDKDLYYEYGFGIENIGVSNFRLLRIDFNWRGNYLDTPEVSKFGVKFGFFLTF